MANKKLSALITIGGTVSNSLKSAFKSTKSQLGDLGKTITDLNKRQRLLGRSIQEFGRAGKNVDSLRLKYAGLGREIDKLRIKQDRLNKFQMRQDKIKSAGGKIMSAGLAVGAGGAGIVGALHGGIKESEHYDTEKARIEALGMGDEVNREAFKFAKDMKTYGTSMLENLELIRDGMSVFGDLHHAEMVAPLLAKMKFGNTAFFGQEKGEENTKQFMDMLKVIETRGGLQSEEEFKKQANIIQQVIAATGGRVTASEWRNLIATGGLAAKGMSDEALYYTMEHLVQEQGGDKVGTGLSSLYASLYQGRTTKRAANNLENYGLIADHSKVKHDKAGQVSFMDPGALKGADVLRRNPFEWMETVLLPTLKKQGIEDKDEILDIIGSIVSNRKGGDLLAAMYMQREQIHKSEKLNRGAFNIDQLDEKGRTTANGKTIALQKKYADLQLKVGEQLLPLFVKGLEMASGALDKLNGFMEKNPELSKGILITLGALGAAFAVLAPVLVTVAAGVIAFGAVTLPVVGTIALVTAGVAAFGAALIALYSKWQTIKGWFSPSSPERKAGAEMQYDLDGNPIGYAQPEAPAMANKSAPAPNVTITNDIKITQQPGQDNKDLAKQVIDQINRDAATRKRSMLFDGAGAR